MKRRQTEYKSQGREKQKNRPALKGELIDHDAVLTVRELCDRCMLETDHVVTLVQEGVLEASGPDQALWTFHFSSIRRIRTAARLQRDLGVNLAGAALALELLDRISELQKNRA